MENTEWLTVPEAIARMRCSDKWLYQLVKTHDFKKSKTKKGRRIYAIPTSFLKDNGSPSVEKTDAPEDPPASSEQIVLKIMDDYKTLVIEFERLRTEINVLQEQLFENEAALTKKKEEIISMLQNGKPDA